MLSSNNTKVSTFICTYISMEDSELDLPASQTKVIAQMFGFFSLENWNNTSNNNRIIKSNICFP